MLHAELAGTNRMHSGGWPGKIISFAAACGSRRPTLPKCFLGSSRSSATIDSGEAAKLKAVVLVRIDAQPQAMKISLIGVRLSFRGQLDEICPHSVSDLGTL